MVALMGDLNAEPMEGAMQFLVGKHMLVDPDTKANVTMTGMIDAWTSTHPTDDGLTFNMLDVKPAADRAAANKAKAVAAAKEKAAKGDGGGSNDDNDDDDDDVDEQEDDDEEDDEGNDADSYGDDDDDGYDGIEADAQPIPMSEKGLKKRIDYIIMKGWAGIKLDEVATIPRGYHPNDPPASDHLGVIMQLSMEKERM